MTKVTSWTHQTGETRCTVCQFKIGVGDLIVSTTRGSHRHATEEEAAGQRIKWGLPCKQSAYKEMR